MNNINGKYLNKRTVIDYCVITLGTFLISVAVMVYMEPCRIITGSVSGLALVIREVLPLSVPMITLILNMVCLLAGFRFLGQKFGVRSVYVSVLLPLFMKLVPVLLHNSIPACGMLKGTAAFLIILTEGQCLLFASNTASGGLDTIAEIIAAKTRLSRGSAIGLLGILCAAATVLVYGVQTAVFGAVVTVINGKMVNLVMEDIPAVIIPRLHRAGLVQEG